MQKTLLHIVRFLLLPLAILPVFYAFFFQLQEKTNRQQMRKELRKGNLITVVATQDEFYWLEQGKELMLNGRAFDVSSYRYEKGVYVFTGLYDDVETELMCRKQKKQEQENTDGNKILVFLFELFQAYQETFEEATCTMVLPTGKFRLYSSALSSAFYDITIPPPKPGNLSVFFS